MFMSTDSFCNFEMKQTRLEQNRLKLVSLGLKSEILSILNIFLKLALTIFYLKSYIEGSAKKNRLPINNGS